MKFFSKIVFICNLCFATMVVMHFVNLHNEFKGKLDTLKPLPYLTGTIAVLGEIAIIINLIFFVLFIFLILFKKSKQIPTWVVIGNFITLLAQFYWFFIYKSK